MQPHSSGNHSSENQSSENTENTRILIIDDTKSIHEDFKKLLNQNSSASNEALDSIESALFDDEPTEETSNNDANVIGGDNAIQFEIDSAYQGEEAFEMVKKALAEGRPYAMAFCDMRMPPGWDGVETLQNIWQVDPHLQAVICTAFSDYSWNDMLEKLGNQDRLLILKKPFENVEALQSATAMVSKWNWHAKANLQMENLENLVKQRTEKIGQQKLQLQTRLEELEQTRLQLVQSEKLASIGQLAAGVAHEINNPVGFISSNLNTLNEYVSDIQKAVEAYRGFVDICTKSEGKLGELAGEAKSVEENIGLDFVMEDIGTLLNDALEGTQRVRKIVGDLSEFSHVNGPDITSEDINNLLEKTISVASNELKYKAEIQKEFGDIPKINCYGGKLAQVFLNLLINSAHAIDDRGTITLRTGQLNEEKIWIEIQDTGCGISEENQIKMFDPFFTTKDVGEGTGLGLHIVRSVIETHHGDISIDSTIGKGTTFRIILPIASELEESATSETADKEEASAQNPKEQRKAG